MRAKKNLVYPKADAPCLDCEDRHMLCHQDCKKYLDWQTNYKAIQNGIYNDWMKDNAVYTYNLKVVDKIKKRRNEK